MLIFYMEYYACIKGYLKNIENAADVFINKDDFREFSDFGIRGFSFSIKGKSGDYNFFATQLLENGIPNSDTQIVVAGPRKPEVCGYLNEFSVWIDLKKFKDSFDLLEVPIKKENLDLKL